MPNQKGFSRIVLIIAIVVFIGVLAYIKLGKKIFISDVSSQAQQSGEVNEWKIYTDQNLGFKIEYPLTWEVVKELDHNNDGEITYEFILAEKGPGIKVFQTPGLMVTVERETPKELFKGMSNFKRKIISNKLISFSGIPNTQEITLDNDSKYLMLPYQGKTVIIKTWGRTSLINDILATFKFTN